MSYLDKFHNGCTIACRSMNREAAISRWAQLLGSKTPLAAAPVIARWIVDLKVVFVISKPRKTKLGDFRPPHNGKPAKITVNSDLNPYNFLITTVHEFAHLGCHLKHGNKVNPHGTEWKEIYSDLLRNFISTEIFPSELIPVLNYHISNPAASSCSCPVLSKALAQYNKNPGIFLDEVKHKEIFIFREEIYTRLEKRRTRYLCRRLSDGRKYLISERAQVEIPSAHLNKVYH